jgi:hypothetical protein
MKILIGLVAVAVLIQLIPRGRVHTNPAITKEPAWNSPQTADLARRACYDCHSNETTWPWYSKIAPVSWLVSHDVNTGRRHLNFTQWDQPQRHAKDVAEQLREDEMPPWYYTPLHPRAKLSDAEKQAFIAGAEKSFGPQAGPEQASR